MSFLLRILAMDKGLPPKIKEILEDYLSSQIVGKISATNLRLLKTYVHNNDLLQRGYNLPIYRGLIFEHWQPLATLKSEVLTFSRRPYESWTKNSSVAREFIRLPARYRWKFGVLLQRDIDRDDVIVDVDYLHHKNALPGYPDEKEILTEQFCHSCPISAIKLIRVHRSSLEEFENKISEQGWRADITAPMLKRSQMSFEFSPHIKAKRFQRLT